MENGDDVNATRVGSGDQAGGSVSPSTVGWAVAAIALSIFMIAFNNSASVLGASFMVKVFAFLVGVISGTVGALIGNAIRKFAMPDAIFTRNGMTGLLWARIFWSVGPQLIGLCIGVILGISIVLQ